MDKTFSFAREMFGGARPQGGLAPEYVREPGSSEPPPFYRDNPNYPYPKGTFPPAPEDWTGSRGAHRWSGLPAYPVPEATMRPEDSGFYVPDPEREGYARPASPLFESDVDEDKDGEDGDDVVEGEAEGGEADLSRGRSMAGMALTPAELDRMRALLRQSVLPSRPGRGPIPSDPYRGTFDRYLPED